MRSFILGGISGLVLAIVGGLALFIWRPDWSSGLTENTLVQDVFYATPRAQFMAQLEASPLADTDLAVQWQTAWQNAKQAPVEISLPYAETGRFATTDPAAFAYQFFAQQGQTIQVTLTTAQQTKSDDWFVELYQQQDSGLDFRKALELPSFSPSSRADNDDYRLRYTSEQSSTYVLVLQVPLLKAADYTLQLESVSQMTFPVQGYDSRAIQSFFGAPRDGGRRKHRGVDIFAPRGTPLVAVADGVVTSTRDNKLGGKVVWMRGFDHGRTYYYAHLDSVAVKAGQTVSAGEPVGTVGNTGNARYTPPHLHFSIYHRGTAFDPLPFLQAQRLSAKALHAVHGNPVEWDHRPVAATINGLNFRAGPDTSFAVIRRLTTAEPLRVLAHNAKWLRVMTVDGVNGFVAAKYVRPVVNHELQEKPKSERQLLAVDTALL